ncbi:MAG: hypothetical protein H8E14_10245 [Candidatus Marinimicrobia bacterium]|nr:hypothetical protein [Candidatus Neomarinimicrobiota bacterium]
MGINHFRLPVKATRFLKANPITGKVYNSYNWGGYLIWELYPQKQVFIDGRAPAYPSKFIDIASQFRQYPQAFKAIDNIYRFQYLFFPKATSPGILKNIMILRNGYRFTGTRPVHVYISGTTNKTLIIAPNFGTVISRQVSAMRLTSD